MFVEHLIFVCLSLTIILSLAQLSPNQTITIQYNIYKLMHQRQVKRHLTGSSMAQASRLCPG